MDLISYAGRDWNEDYAYFCEDYAFVLDGATSLVPIKYSNFSTDAEWYTKTFGKYLETALSNNMKNINEIIKDGIKYVTLLYKNLANGREIIDMPSACVTVVRKHNGRIEYFVLGDSGFLFKHNNIIRDFSDTRIVELDKKNIDDMVKIAKEKKINVIDARHFVDNDIMKKRLSKNSEDGYWILCDDFKACDYALQGKLDIEKGDEILLYTDGFSEIWNLFKMYNEKQIFEEINRGQTLNDLYKKLYLAQKEDAGCNNFPRTKIRDDATAIYVRF